MSKPFTDETIAEMEADDGRQRILPLEIRRALADEMRRANESHARWVAWMENE